MSLSTDQQEKNTFCIELAKDIITPILTMHVHILTIQSTPVSYMSLLTFHLPNTLCITLYHDPG